MKQFLQNIPNRATWWGLGGLTISIPALLWHLWEPLAIEWAPWALGCLAAVSTLLLYYSAGIYMLNLAKALRRLWDRFREHRGWLQKQLSQGNHDLQLQMQMLEALQSEKSVTDVLKLAGEFLGVTHVSCWQSSLREKGNGQLRCLESVAPDAQLHFKPEDLWYEQDFPLFFQKLRMEDPIVLPKPHWKHGHRAPLGSLLHYIDENHVKSLLIVPVKAKNGATGIIWFEDRNHVHQWNDRTLHQANFVANILYLELERILRKRIISQLSNEAHKLNALQEGGPVGWGYYKLPVPCLVDEDFSLKMNRVANAQLEEAPPSYLDITHQQLGDFIHDIFHENEIALFLEGQGVLDDAVWFESGKWLEGHAIGVWVGQELQGLWVSVQDITAQEEEKAKQQKLLGSISNLVVTVDEDNKIIEDAPMIAQLGYEAEQRIGHGLPSYLHQDDIDKLEMALWHARRQQKEQICTGLRVRRNLGGFAPFDAKIFPQGESGEATIEMISTELRQATEEHLKGEIDFFKRLISASTEAIGIIGSQEKFDYVSDNWKALFGYEPESRKGRYALEYFHQQNASILSQRLQKILSGEISQHQQEAHFLNRKGEWVRVQVGLYALKNEEQRLEGVVFKMGPVPGDTQAVSRLKNREALFQELINADTRAYLLMGPKGRIRFATENVSSILGFSSKELVGKPLLPIVKEEEKGAFEKNFSQWKLDPQAQHTAHFSIRHQDGTWKALHLSHLGHVSNEAYAGIMVALEAPIAGDGIIDTQIELRADFFMGLANSLPFATWFIDHAGQVKFTNKEARNWLGFSPKGNMQSFLDARSIETVNAAGHVKQASLRIKNSANTYWQAQALIAPLEGSVVKGKILMVLPKSEEVRQLMQAVEKAEREVERVVAEKRAVTQRREDWEQELEQKREELKSLQKGHEKEIEYLEDRLDLIQSALVSKNAEINRLETQQKALEGLQEQNEHMQKHFDDLRDLLYMFDELSPEANWPAKWQEIQNFKKIINYGEAMNFARQYLARLQQALAVHS